MSGAIATKVLVLQIAFSSENKVDSILVSFTIAQIVLNSASDTNQSVTNFSLLLLIQALISCRATTEVCQQDWEGGAAGMHPPCTQTSIFNKYRFNFFLI